MRKIPNKNKVITETKTITVEGMLSGDYFMNTAFNTVIFTNEDGYKTDLFAKFAELVLNYGTTFTVRIYIAPEKTTKENIMTEFVMTIMGFPIVEFDKQEYSYSEYTSGIDYVSELNIGGHNLYAELSSYSGRYCILEIDVEIE